MTTCTEPTRAELIAAANTAIDTAITAIVALREAHDVITTGIIATRNAVADAVETDSTDEYSDIRRAVWESYCLANSLKWLTSHLQNQLRLTAPMATLAYRQAEDVDRYAKSKHEPLNWL